MEIFVSWSGKESLGLAKILHKWIGRLVQGSVPWMSSEDISIGERWNSQISESLSRSNFGVIILTPNNTDSNWIMFESGAIAKSIDQGKVVPILFGGLSPIDIPSGPLTQFQGIVFDELGFRKLLNDINENMDLDNRVARDDLNELITVSWPKIVQETSAIEPTDIKVQSRTDTSKIDEILSLSRTLNNRTNYLRVADSIPFSSGSSGEAGPPPQPYLSHYLSLMSARIDAGQDPSKVEEYFRQILPEPYWVHLESLRYSVQLHRAQASKAVGSGNNND